MKQPTTSPLVPALPLALLLTLAGCIENEEEIEVRADGSVQVTIHAKGDVRDFAEGYPVPLDARWEPLGEAAALWLREVGPETGGVHAFQRVQEIDWSALGIDPGELRLSSRAQFASVEDWPRFLAPTSEPYREAFSERSAELRIERRGPYKVYTFERTFHGRPSEGYDLFHTLFSTLEDWPEDLSKRIEERQALNEAEWTFITDEIHAVFELVYHNLARDAVAIKDGGPYTRAVAARIATAVTERVAGLITIERMQRILAEGRALEEQGEDDAAPLIALEQEARAVLRAALAQELESAGIKSAARYTVLGRLEFGLTASDHTMDLGDEKFHVSVRMPGTIVSGNYDELSDETATWKFEADAMFGRDQVLSIVSILE